MKQSAGLLVYRMRNDQLEVLLTRPGGPFWAGKDEWSIPKGEVDPGESLMETLKREFTEETGWQAPDTDYINLGEAALRDKSKTNYIWAAEADYDISTFHCDSTVTMPWPPRSGKTVTFPENDAVAWMDMATARARIFRSQIVFLERLAQQIGLSWDEAVRTTGQTDF